MQKKFQQPIRVVTKYKLLKVPCKGISGKEHSNMPLKVQNVLRVLHNIGPQSGSVVKKFLIQATLRPNETEFHFNKRLGMFVCS